MSTNNEPIYLSWWIFWTTSYKVWITSSRDSINWNCCCNSAHLHKNLCLLVTSRKLCPLILSPWVFFFGPLAVTSPTLPLQYLLGFCWSLFLQLSCGPNTLDTCKYCGVHMLHVYISCLLCRQIYFWHVASVMPDSCSGTIWIAKPFVAEFSFWDAAVQYLNLLHLCVLKTGQMSQSFRNGSTGTSCCQDKGESTGTGKLNPFTGIVFMMCRASILGTWASY